MFAGAEGVMLLCDNESKKRTPACSVWHVLPATSKNTAAAKPVDGLSQAFPAHQPLLYQLLDPSLPLCEVNGGRGNSRGAACFDSREGKALASHSPP